MYQKFLEVWLRWGQEVFHGSEIGMAGKENTKPVRSELVYYYKKVLPWSIYPSSWYLRTLIQTFELL